MHWRRGNAKMNNLSPQCISSTAEIPAGARMPASEATSSHCKSRHQGAPRRLLYCPGCRRRHCPSGRCRGARPAAKVHRTTRRPQGSSSYRHSRGPLRHRSPSRVELPLQPRAFAATPGSTQGHSPRSLEVVTRP
jgi:hypothetical protein